MIKKIGILTFWEFPEGMAPTTRILAYSKGLIENDVDVEIFSFKRIFEDQKLSENITKSGKVDKVKYTYIHFFNNLGKKYKAFRVFDEIVLRIRLIFMILRSHRKTPFDSFIFSFDDLHNLPIYIRIFRLFNFPVFIIADEYPIPIRGEMQECIPKEMILKYRKFNEFFAGRILMSKGLQEFYDHEISEKPTFILNTIIDSDRFVNLKKIISDKEYICYMGNMGLNKDNVDNIIRAFSLIESIYPNVELHLYGTPSQADKKVVLNLIETLNLNERVFLKGRASYDKVPSILQSAKILVNSQPITKRAEGGFPTKLGEYLLTGVPSIFTDSGDISKIIKNDEHAFIVKPEDEVAYSQILVKILDNYENAQVVGEKGKIFILDNFDAREETLKLIKFLSEFSNPETF